MLHDFKDQENEPMAPQYTPTTVAGNERLLRGRLEPLNRSGD